MIGENRKSSPINVAILSIYPSVCLSFKGCIPSTVKNKQLEYFVYHKLTTQFSGLKNALRLFPGHKRSVPTYNNINYIQIAPVLSEPIQCKQRHKQIFIILVFFVQQKKVKLDGVKIKLLYIAQIEIELY